MRLLLVTALTVATLTRASLDAMQQPTALTSGDISPYGFGVEIVEDHGLRAIEHGGGDPGFAAFVVRYPERRLAVAVLCNLDNIGYSIAALSHSVAGVYLPNSPGATTATSTPPPVSLPVAELAALPGVYRDAATGRFGRLFVRDGMLRVSSDAGTTEQSWDLQPIGANRFVIPQTPVVVEAVAPSPGRPRELHVTGDGPKPSVMQQVRTVTPSPQQCAPWRGRTSARTWGQHTRCWQPATASSCGCRAERMRRSSR